MHPILQNVIFMWDDLLNDQMQRTLARGWKLSIYICINYVACLPLHWFIAQVRFELVLMIKLTVLLYNSTNCWRNQITVFHIAVQSLFPKKDDKGGQLAVD